MKNILQNIELDIEDNQTYILRIKDKYFNNCWFVHFGSIQQQLLMLKNKTIIIDMKKCSFISPTPFLSLLLTLKKCKLNGCELLFQFSSEYENAQDNFYLYCKENGFYQIIEELSAQGMKEIQHSNVEWKEHANYEKLIEAQILDLSEEKKSIEDIVNSILSKINEEKIQLKNKNKNYFMVVLRNVLTELLDNVKKHAYENEENKLCAVYIRTRRTNNKTIYIGKINNKYNAETVKPAEIYLQNAVEIYFQDLGQGMVASLEKKGKIQKSKRPLREAIQKTFYSNSNKARSSNTAVTGLQFLGELMADRNEFISIYDQYEGVGTFTTEKLQRKERKLNTNKVCLSDIGGEYKALKGLIYNFTLFNRDILNKVEYFEHKEEVWKIYSQGYQNLKFDVVNYRDDFKFNDAGTIIDEDWLWIIPKEKNTKSMIVDCLLETLKKYSKQKLVIADIEDDELILFRYTLVDSYVNVIDFQNNLKEIYLVSKKLRFYKFVKDERNILREEQESFLTFNKRTNYLYKMKIYESKVLATLIETTLLKDYVITKGVVIWNPNLKLKGYINFDILVSNNETNLILERNIQRILPYISDCHIYPIDLLTKRIVDLINIELEENQSKKIEYVGVGSVIVSGLTLQSNNFENNLNIHFFSRAKNERQAALFFDPIYLYAQDKEYETYVRNGKSYRIQPSDLEPIKVKTNSYIKEPVMYKLLHQLAYSSVFFGHLDIENRHDIFNINLNAFIYDRGTLLSKFIEEMIMSSLGHYIDDYEKNEQGNIFFKELEYSSMIIYPYNSITSSIFSQCQLMQKFKEYIWGLTPVNIIYSGETLEFSDTYKKCLLDVINRFNERYNNTKKIKVVVFDTLTYTGRTKENIKKFLKSLTNVEVNFVNVIDAQISHYDKPATELNYMNLNIPLLGNSATCEICTVLDKIVIFQKTLIDAKLVSKIEEIIKLWRVRDIRNFQNSLLLPNFSPIKATHFMKDNSRYFVDEKIEFRNILPLYLYMTNRIKLENDFSIIEDILDKESGVIDEHSIAFMCAVFMMEYGDKSYLSILHKVSKKIFDMIFKPSYKGEDTIYQLCLLALLNIDEKIIWRILKKYLYEMKNRKQLLSSSYEGQILLLYYITHIQNDEMLGKEEFFYILKNKCKSGNGRLDLYKQFNCQLINTNGNVHNSPLRCVVDNKVKNIHMIRSSLELIKQSLTSYDLKFDILYENRKSEENGDEYNELIENCLNYISILENKIKNDEYEYQSEKHIIEKLYNACLAIHSKLFAPYFISLKPEDRDKEDIIEKLINVIDEYNSQNSDNKIIFDNNYKVLDFLDKDISAIYYIWNNLLEREIYYILDNVAKYTKNRIFIENEIVAGQVQIKINELDFNVFVYNNSDESIDNIKRALKQRYQKEVLDMLGITIEYYKNGKNSEIYNNNFEEGAVVVEIKIPNIYKIRREKG